jgi:lactate permease
LIGGLVLSRLYLPLGRFLQAAGRLQPFADAPAWSPFLHAGSWLLVGALLVGLVRRDFVGLREEMAASWRIGRVAVLGIVQFSIMAEILSGSGIAGALATGVYDVAGRWALLATPLLSGTFGLLTNGGNAPNGLFMSSQINLARLAELSIPAVIALQHFSGSMMSMFSPVRMAIVCGLAGTPGHERAAYRDMLPHMLGLLVVLMGAALLICLRAI